MAGEGTAAISALLKSAAAAGVSDFKSGRLLQSAFGAGGVGECRACDGSCGMVVSYPRPCGGPIVPSVHSWPANACDDARIASRAIAGGKYRLIAPAPASQLQRMQLGDPLGFAQPDIGSIDIEFDTVSIRIFEI